MRRLIVALIAAVAVGIASFGTPAVASAQTTSLLASVSGQAVDAGGRVAAGQRVELVQQGVVLQTARTGARGEFSFTNVPAGDYVVRVMINNVPAGIRISLAPGAAAANATIVLPSAVAPQGPFIAALGLLGGLLAGTAVVIGGVIIAKKVIS